MTPCNRHIPILFSIIVHAPRKDWIIDTSAYCEYLGIENKKGTIKSIERAIKYIFDLGLENFPHKDEKSRILSAYSLLENGDIWIRLCDDFYEILRTEDATRFVVKNDGETEE